MHRGRREEDKPVMGIPISEGGIIRWRDARVMLV